jgi:hypothetical protein
MEQRPTELATDEKSPALAQSIQQMVTVDQRLVLTALCQNIVPWTYQDIMSMAFVHSGWLAALKNTAKLRNNWFKEQLIQEKNKTNKNKSFKFIKGTWHPLGCAFATWVFYHKKNINEDSSVDNIHLLNTWVTEISSGPDQLNAQPIFGKTICNILIQKEGYCCTWDKTFFTLTKNENNFMIFPDPIFKEGQFRSTIAHTIDGHILVPLEIALYYSPSNALIERVIVFE